MLLMLMSLAVVRTGLYNQSIGGKLCNIHVSKMMTRNLFYEQNDYFLVIVTLIAIFRQYVLANGNFDSPCSHFCIGFSGMSHIMQLLLAERKVLNW